MSLLAQALALAGKGFWVFPLVPLSKLPAIDAWQKRATRDEATIRAWWTCPVTGWEQDFNIGICTTRFGDNEALVLIDIDNKGDKHGDTEILRLELAGCDFPATYEQRTPSGGRHLVYRHGVAVKQGVDVLGPGLDLRSRGGFAVAAGSVLATGRYEAEVGPVAEAPAWLIERCGRAPEREPATKHAVNVDVDNAIRRATRYLMHEAQLAVQGQGGDETTFKVAARLKDIGVPEVDAPALMADWNERCTPPWTPEELATKVHNAYRYGQSAPGSASPEADFGAVTNPRQLATNAEVSQQPVGHPYSELNKDYAFVLAGGGHHILWETTDAKGNFRLEHLAEPSFHRKHASYMMQSGEKMEPVTKLWMAARERRTYDGLCFRPGVTPPPGWYNLWRGFAVEPASEPASEEAAWAVEAWKEHLLVNVCRGDKELAHWLTGWFAHLVQHPDDKPLVALVFRGGKGVGKNALIELGMGPAKNAPGILGSHSLIVTDRRYLVGNFNSHKEMLLLLTFDEAFWSGDKQAEGILKGLITSGNHVIERKGHEPYTIENKCRVCIIGNEDWLVPASHDERRFAVFDVGDGRRNDRKFFGRMERGMAAGGSGLLLRYLLDYDLSGVDVNEAPKTGALLDQKTATLEPFYQWWLDCLTEGWLVGSDFGGAWPEEVEKERFRHAFARYLKERNVRTRMPEERILGRLLKKCAPGVTAGKRRDGAALTNTYKLPGLEQLRGEWARYIGHEVVW